MKGFVARLLGRECAHEQVLVVRTASVERQICEACGHLSFEIAASPRGWESSKPDLRRPDYPRVVNL